MRYAGVLVSVRPWRIAMCVAGALLGATVALAADRIDVSAAQAAYQRDLAACNSGQTNQDRPSCLREAGAALQEAGRSRPDGKPDQFEENRLLRCDSQPAEDRQDCVRRMNGEGTTSGSVDGGGIIRELVTPQRN